MLWSRYDCRRNIDHHRLLMTTPIEEVFQTECYVKDFVKGIVSPEEIYEDPAPLDDISPNGSNMVRDNNLVQNEISLSARRRRQNKKKYKQRHNTVRHIKPSSGVEEDADV
jgi:hypothetical protein